MIAQTLVALGPVLGLLGLGYVLRVRSFVSSVFWAPAERLCYFVLLPALFIHGLATADLAGLPISLMAPVLAGPVVLTALGLVVAQRWMQFDGPAFTSVLQGSIRFNNYLGLSIALALFGPDGVALAAIANAILVPLVNVICTLAFARYGAETLTAGGTVRSIVTNPLILGCVIGISLNLTGIGLPPGIAEFVRTLGSASLPLGLLCVGAALELRSMTRNLWAVGLAGALKFGVMPGLGLAGCLLVGLTGEPAATVVLFLALPTASSAFVMARALGGDARLMASTITLQTVAGVLYLPAVFLVLARFTA
ncbi:AEC family transporter [Arthrobacter echini]|uniref:AEC family transporter n=1 Tax=Arthrobacter echini TaxID=1529066 RepID=A0A5D0XWQ6_9MICC|nr:AEC family transporter [Arthrobacter echini]TYD00687.1 AEC family transporter [Arthrobacter echini]